ncbi:polysaccharide pyruvyl transferase family protein [Alteromonas stellipolaris]|uniref:polysaccharide pyruvyl transferase family protein n=1 Tax=Alteromonas stellipolaris TaxID=233316 RepID=UPI001DE12C50|nr:polysaccharide pyruvyl transferase family protein [Alteromonas stellipolaris]MBZ2163147.1 polysaccharide pyruvyl transferase family protein [Alteromonas stellipolaris]
MFKRIKGSPKVENALKLQNKVYFWNPKDKKPNIGDYLAYETVLFALNLKDKHPLDIATGKILSIGSVLHFANDNDVIWGTGRNGKVNENKHTFSKLDVRSVRGPLTKAYLEGKGIAVPEMFGDPGILAPFIYPKDLLNTVSKHNKSGIVVVPQLNDNFDIYNAYKDQLVSPRQLPANFISQICNAEKVITSSLHGIVLAEAFGIPAVFYDSGSGENIFKYNDYYQGTGRQDFAIGKSIEECLDLSTQPIPDLYERQLALFASFPFDRFQ